jgi:hypothetical protein
MIAPVALLALSLVGVGVALGVPGLSDLLLVAVPCALAAFYLLVRASYRRDDPDWPKPDGRPTSPLGRWKKAPPKWIVVDGSNVMHWRDGQPGLEPVRDVLDHLTRQGYSPGVVFDANAGYLISDRYMHHEAFGRLLGLPEHRVMVVPKGTQADATVLLAARDLGARVVTNDRYRDWAEQYPEVSQPGHLIRGGFRDGKLWLGLDEPAGQVVKLQGAATP